MRMSALQKSALFALPVALAAAIGVASHAAPLQGSGDACYKLVMVPT
jgi:hypothetical protein